MKIQKWGNSLALRIPSALARQARLAQGADVDIEVVRGRLVIRPARNRSFSLKQLLKRVTTRNVHRGIDDGGPVGRELL